MKNRGCSCSMGFTVCLLFLLVSPVLAANSRNGQDAAGNKISSFAAGSNLGRMELPYYTLRDGFNSTLNLVSATGEALAIQIDLHAMSGRTIRSAPMLLDAGVKRQVNIRALVLSAGENPDGEFGEGSLSVVYDSQDSMPLVGQITVSDPSRKLVFESEMNQMPGTMAGMSPRSPDLNALWWGISNSRDAVFVLTNVAEESATVDISLEFDGLRHAANVVHLRSHEATIIRISSLLSRLNLSPEDVPDGGISFHPRGANARLLAQGHVIDPNSGFSTTLHFLNPESQISSELQATGVPLGQSLKGSSPFGNGDFQPEIAMRNLSTRPQQVDITMSYEDASGTESRKIAHVEIPQLSTKRLDLTEALNTPMSLPYGSVQVHYSGSPGSLIAELTSIDLRQGTVVDSKLTNVGDLTATSGANPWHADAQSKSILLLSNVGDHNEPVALHIQAGGQYYRLTNIVIGPHETRAIDIGHLRDSKAPDYKGNFIPADAQDGSVHWMSLENRTVFGRLVVYNASEGISSNFDCNLSCPCQQSLVAVSIDQDDMNLTPNQTMGCSATKTMKDCHNTYYYYSTGAAWRTGSTSIASITSGGILTAINAGATTVTASISGYSWSYTGPNPMHCVSYGQHPSGSQPVNVYDPTPNITSISPNPWNAGAANMRVQIFGSGFGTNPSVSITDPNGAVSVGPVSPVNDGEVDATVSVNGNAPIEDASVTVTSNGYNGQGFTSNQGNSPTSPSADVQINPLQAPTPEIIFNGSNVAGTTQSTVVGQQIALTTSVNAPIAISSQSWNVPGTPVAGYNASSSSGQVVQLLNFGDPSITFYWVYAGQAMQVTYSYCLVNSQCNSASASFNVSGPTSAGLSTQTNSVNILPGPTIEFGALPNTAGITFTASANLPGQNQGTYSFVQLINSERFQVITGTGSESCIQSGFVSDPSAEIDNTYPYPTEQGCTNCTNDSPSQQPLSTFGEVQRSFSPTMYLLWTPNADPNCASGSACTIPVPLGFVNWRYSADAINALSAQSNGTTWDLSCGAGSANTFQVSSPSQSASGYPTWTKTWLNGGAYQCSPE